MKQALLVPELAEIYLLLDNVSGVADKRLPDLSDDPLFKDGGGSWIEQVCAIRWPPDPRQPQKNAQSAAKLIRAKDELNRMAWPASGASVAFNLMLSGESPRLNSGQSWWSRLVGAQPEPEMRFGNPLDRLCSGQPLTRRSLAAIAYPTLQRGMRTSRRIYLGLNWFLLVMLILTCWMSWQVATGVALLNRVNALVENERIVRSAVDRGTIRESDPRDTATPLPAETEAAGPAADILTNQSAAGDTRSVAPKIAEAPVDEDRREGAEPVDIVASDPNLRIPISNLVQWVVDHRGLASLVGGGEQAPVYYSQEKPPNDVKSNVEWAAVLIAVLAGTVLPILYGVLGASAAVVRSVAFRMRNNTLMPRDLLLAMVQLGLGAVIGACVGLFVSSDGPGEEGGLVGAVQLSGSALCFLAGFGVEGVFRALESLLSRVFPMSTTSLTPDYQRPRPSANEPE